MIGLYCILDGVPMDTDLKRGALSLQKSLKWDDATPQLAAALGGEVVNNTNRTKTVQNQFEKYQNNFNSILEWRIRSGFKSRRRVSLGRR
jgi:hypothetical protein